MRVHILTSFALAAAGAAALYAAQAPSSQPQPQEPRPPTFRTEANYVRVDAYPTRNGVPVQDLTADDFEVFEDNKPQAIQQFEHVVVNDEISRAAAELERVVRDELSLQSSDG